MHRSGMLTENSVSIIYSSHALEYNDGDEVDELLAPGYCPGQTWMDQLFFRKRYTI